MKKFLSALSLSFISLCAAAQETPEPELKGDGSLESPFAIEDAFDFSVLLSRMEKYDYYTKGKYFALTGDIRLNSGVLDSDGSLSADSLGFSSWKPIGNESNGREFYGHFDGRGHTISGLYINEADGKNLGLFGVIGKDGEVSNLKLADSYICGNTFVGGIAGSSKGKITQCESSATVVAKGSTHVAGGIAGNTLMDGAVKKCINTGHVRGITFSDESGWVHNCSTGGIIGSGARADSCENRGTVISDGWGAAGGIAGSVGGAQFIYGCVNYGDVINRSNDNVGGIVGTNWATVYYSTNYGSVSATEPGACIGGIAGRNSYNATVRGSENFAEIHSDVDSVFVGGIVGNLDGGREYDKYYTPKVYSSANHGNISTTSPKSQCAGIAARSCCGEMHECTNTGIVTGRNLAGGILCKGEFHTNIYACVNEGAVSGLKSTGGIAGNINGEVRDSRNSGLISNIEKDSDCGGIVGWLSGSSGIIRYCVNTGEVSSGKHVGGLAGDNESRSSIISSYNAGYVHSDTEGAYIGGVSGGSGILRNCYNAGTVHAEAPGIKAGGLTNNLWVNWDSHGNRSGSTATNCYNAGNIIVAAADCTAGNIAATYEVNNSSYLFDNCYYLQDAIYGRNYAYTDSVADGYNTSKLKGISREEFATLAESINRVEYPWDPLPYVQGRWRPLLVSNDYDAEPEPVSFFDVLTASGDTVAVDLGLPLGNEFFHIDADSPALLAYNVAADGTVRNAVLVDDADFSLDGVTSVGKLHYLRHASKGFNFSCLPVAVGGDNFPGAAEISVPAALMADTLQLRRTAAAAPYEAFMFDGSDMPGYWAISLSDITLEPQPANDGTDSSLIVGTTTKLDRLPAGAYLLTADRKSLRRASDSDTAGPFRAFVSLPETAPETVGLSYNNNSSSIETIDAMKDRVFAERTTVVVATSADKCPVEIYSANGTLVKRVIAAKGRNEIEVAIPGAYIVRLSGKAYKVLLH